MAASKYDVYISNGKDTVTGFTGHLEKGFNEKGISISKDNPEAIETSRVFIVVLSKDYPFSLDRLDELGKIVNTTEAYHVGHQRVNTTKTYHVGHQRIFPVFYHVELYHVRYQMGDFGDVLKSHQNSVSLERYQGWIDAMKFIADIIGFHIQRALGKDEAQYIEEIYQKVSYYVPCTVGLHGRVLDHDAHELLCLKILKSKLIKPSHVSIIKRAAVCASGHPFLLEVIGSNLCGKGLKEQKSTLDQYEKIHNEEKQEMLLIKKIVQLSVDTLEKGPREKLIYIAYHLVGNKSKKVVEGNLHAVFGGCPKEDMKVLLNKSLIKINEDDQVTLHDSIMDMVQGIDSYEDNVDHTKMQMSASFGVRSAPLLPR